MRSLVVKKLYVLMWRVGLMMMVAVVWAAEARAQDVASYDSLDEAIESEIEGIDFSDMSDIGDCAIMGETAVEAESLTAFVVRHNPGFDPEIARQYVEVGRRYGIRGDIAFCQAILETGWFRFEGLTAVDREQHNYCGLGVVRRGLTGASFETVAEGVTAHIQHLYAYATDSPLPEGEELVDPRFAAVRRASATTWFGLSNRWAMNPQYGERIMKIYSGLIGD